MIDVKQLAAHHRTISKIMASLQSMQSTLADWIEAQTPQPLSKVRGVPRNYVIHGKQRSLGHLQFRLVKYLAAAVGNYVPIEELREHVYPEEESVADGKLRKLIFDTKKALDNSDHPFEIRRGQKSYSLHLK